MKENKMSDRVRGTKHRIPFTAKMWRLTSVAEMQRNL